MYGCMKIYVCENKKTSCPSSVVRPIILDCRSSDSGSNPGLGVNFDEFVNSSFQVMLCSFMYELLAQFGRALDF